MNSAPVPTPAAEDGQDQRAILFGRFMLPDSSEHPCQVVQLSPDGAVFLTSTAAPPAGLRIVAYLDEIGRVEAVTGDPVEGGFAVSFRSSGQRRERLQSRIRALRGASADDAEVADRRDPLHQGTHEGSGASHITLPDGRVYPCEVMDVSVSGAAIRTHVLPAVGTFVLLGKMSGRVVRYLDRGVSIEFTTHADGPATPPHQPR